MTISDIYIDPLFRGILNPASQRRKFSRAPRLVMDWNMLQGCWSIENEIVAVTRADAAELLDGLSRLEASDLAEHCADYTIEECIRCATVLRDFIGKVLIRGETLLIEDD